jgi:hypothetical protein
VVLLRVLLVVLLLVLLRRHDDGKNEQQAGRCRDGKKKEGAVSRGDREIDRPSQRPTVGEEALLMAPDYSPLLWRKQRLPKRNSRTINVDVRLAFNRKGAVRRKSSNLSETYE